MGTGKKGKILKVIGGLNPNCSSGMFMAAYTMLAVPVHLVVDIVASIILYVHNKKTRSLEDFEVFSAARTLKKLWYIMVKGEMSWSGPETPVILIILLASIPPVSLIISVFVGDRIAYSRTPKAVFLSPVIYFLLVVVLSFVVPLVHYYVIKLTGSQS
jgi:hypothetical protein